MKQDAAGLFRYEVLADPLPGEVTTANNSSPLLLRVVDQPVRVLLLEGKPYWDTKFLIRSLATDESIELTAVVQLAEGRLLERKITRHDKTTDDQWTIEKDAGKFLADRATLASYQIVILGRNAEVFLSDEALTRLAKWLDSNDGSLVCFRGAPSLKINQRLDELMPVRWTASAETRFRAQWTDEGQALRWLPGEGETDPLTAMPALATTAQPKVKPYVATVLATNAGGGRPGPGPRVLGAPLGAPPGAPTVPLVTYRAAGSVGSGRVVAVEGAGMWRWAFLPPQHQDRDELYGSLWRSLIRWLVTNAGMLPSQRLALRAEKCTFNTEEDAVVALRGPRGPLDGRHAADRTFRPRAGTAAKRGLQALGQRAGPIPCRLGPACRRPLPGPRRRGRQGRDVGRGRLRRPRQPQGTAGRGRPAGQYDLDRPGQRRRRVGTGRTAGRGENVRRTLAAQPARAGHPHGRLGPLVAAGRGLRPVGHHLGPEALVGIDLK